VLQRHDHVVDELIQLVEVVLDVLGDIEVHAVSPNAFLGRA
jgi:hypothetical protein